MALKRFSTGVTGQLKSMDDQVANFDPGLNGNVEMRNFVCFQGEKKRRDHLF